MKEKTSPVDKVAQTIGLFFLLVMIAGQIFGMKAREVKHIEETVENIQFPQFYPNVICSAIDTPQQYNECLSQLINEWQSYILQIMKILEENGIDIRGMDTYGFTTKIILTTPYIDEYTGRIFDLEKNKELNQNIKLVCSETGSCNLILHF